MRKILPKKYLKIGSRFTSAKPSCSEKNTTDASPFSLRVSVDCRFICQSRSKGKHQWKTQRAYKSIKGFFSTKTGDKEILQIWSSQIFSNSLCEIAQKILNYKELCLIENIRCRISSKETRTFKEYFIFFCVFIEKIGFKIPTEEIHSIMHLGNALLACAFKGS